MQTPSNIRRQFRRICKELYKHYVKFARRELKAKRTFAIPKFQARRIRELATQVGVENHFAQETFAKLVKKLNQRILLERKKIKDGLSGSSRAGGDSVEEGDVKDEDLSGEGEEDIGDDDGLEANPASSSEGSPSQHGKENSDSLPSSYETPKHMHAYA